MPPDDSVITGHHCISGAIQTPSIQWDDTEIHTQKKTLNRQIIYVADFICKIYNKLSISTSTYINTLQPTMNQKPRTIASAAYRSYVCEISSRCTSNIWPASQRTSYSSCDI